MQHRHETTLTATEYVTQKAWRDATPPACLRSAGPEGCAIHRHGTYCRKTPDGMRVQRWCCRRCQTTFSALPDCLASRYRGTLEDLEAQVAEVESQPSRAAAARALFPRGLNPAAAYRRVGRCVVRVYRCLITARGLSPALYGATPEVLALRIHLNSPCVLRELRAVCHQHLATMPAPLGFALPRCAPESQRAPPTFDGSRI